MPATLTFPGVYVDEVPSGGARPIAAVPTSIAAFVGPVPQGPSDVNHITSLDDFERLYGRIDKDNPLGVAAYQFYLHGGSEAKIARVLASDATSATITLSTPPPPAVPPAQPAPLPDVPVLEASSAGAWGNALRVRVDYTADDFDPREDASKLYNLTISDPLGKRSERFTSISIADASKRKIADALAGSKLVNVKAAGTARPAESPKPEKEGQDPFADDAKPAGVAAGADPPKMWYPASGGGDGTPAKLDYQTPYSLLQNLPDLFNILCVLPAAHGTVIEGTPLSDAAKLCLTRRAFLLVDPPTNWDSVPKAVAGVLSHALIGTEFAKSAAIYFPRLTIFDPTPAGVGEIKNVAPCGAMAGIFARTDAQRGVWKAPAGTAAGFAGVSSFSLGMTDLENGRLNPLGVNCLRAFPGLGRLSWGTRTMAGADTQLDDPSWRYVPIRRLALFIEESLYQGTKWVVFEPNDEPLWSSIRLSVGSFMNRLFRQGAFQGRTPKEAYLVKCDSENNPQADIDRGIVNILVGFAPLKPAEFVLLHIQQLPGDVEA